MIKKLFFLGILSLSFSLNAQSVLAANINNDPTDPDANSLPDELFASSGLLYMYADDASGSNSGGTDLGKELWAFDGITLTFVKDVYSGAPNTNSSVSNFFEFNGNVYFAATDDGVNRSLFITDGTDVGTTEVDLFPAVANDSPSKAIVIGSTAYMSANANDTSPVTFQLIEFDGTTASAVANADPAMGVESISQGTDFVELNGKILMSMTYSTDEATVGRELYAYDPATDLFTLIKDVNTGTSNGDPRNFAKIGSEVYFSTGSGTSGRLWKTDGTTLGTVEVTYSNYPGLALAGHASLFAWDGKLFFEGDVADAIVPAGLTNDDQLFKYDPTDGSLTDLSQQGESHDPADFVAYNGYLYYGGETPGSSAPSLYRTNGNSTSQLLDTSVNRVDSMVLFKDVLYFEAETTPTDLYGRELFKFDTTLSVPTVNFNDEISIYPNPSKNKINVSYNLSTELNYEIFDIAGRNILQGKLLNNTINHSLNSGIYILKLSDKTDSFTQKIVVE